jgi:hypothetical protein
MNAHENQKRLVYLSAAGIFIVIVAFWAWFQSLPQKNNSQVSGESFVSRLVRDYDERFQQPIESFKQGVDITFNNNEIQGILDKVDNATSTATSSGLIEQKQLESGT